MIHSSELENTADLGTFRVPAALIAPQISYLVRVQNLSLNQPKKRLTLVNAYAETFKTRRR